MYKQLISLIFILAFVAVFPFTAAGGSVQWSVKANYVESCSCSPSCPCVYGSKPTLGHCDGTSMVEIEKGHYGDVSLDGITIISAFGTGKWVKYYVSDNATDQQVSAVEKLMPSVFKYHGRAKVLDVQKASLTVERSETKLKYSAPATTVVLARMEGADGGSIKLNNIPIKGFPAPQILNAEQFKSIQLKHKGEDKKFSYSGTNGFVGKIDANSNSDT